MSVLVSDIFNSSLLVLIWICEGEKAGFSVAKRRGHRSIRLGDGPELLRIRDLIAAQQSESMLQSQFIFCFIFLAQIAPVPMKMPREEFQGATYWLAREGRVPRALQQSDLRETAELSAESS
jgi:hypothetical protein